MNRENEAAPELPGNWHAALRSLFPSCIPKYAIWTGIAPIAEALAVIARPGTGHMFFPDGGGGDLIAMARSNQADGMLELFSGRQPECPKMLRPRRLRFMHRHHTEMMAHFLLDFDSISTRPEFPDNAGQFCESFARAADGRTFTFTQWKCQLDDAGQPIPEDARPVMRYWHSGTIAIFSIASPYNNRQACGFDAYNAEHMNLERFNAIVAALGTRIAAGGHAGARSPAQHGAAGSCHDIPRADAET
jgi:hypothetical protein